MKSQKNIKIILIVAFFVTLFILLWFRKGLFLYHDFSFQFDYRKFYTWNNTWVKSINTGEYSVLGLGSLFLGTLVFLFSYIQNILITEILIFLLCFLIASLSSFKFFYELSERNFWIAFSITFFYIFNFFTMNRLYDGHVYLFLVYGLLPITFYFLEKFLVSNRSNKYFLYLIFIILFLGNGFTNIPMMLGTLILPIVIYLVFFSKETANVKRFFLKLQKILLAFTLLSGYWLFPLCYYYLTDYSNSFISSDIQYGLSWPDIDWQSGGFINLFKFNSHWLWGSAWAGDTWYYYYKIFESSPILIILSMAFVFLALFSILKISREIKNGNKVLFKFSIVMLVVSLFLANGTQGIFGRFWEFLYLKIPFFNIFRAPPTKFLGVTVFSVAILITLYLKQIRSNRKLQIFVITVLLVSSCVISSPMISGNIFYRIPKGYWGSRIVKSIPSDYVEIAKIVNSKKLVTNFYEYPFAHFGFFDFGDSIYEGGDLLSLMVTKPLISICSGFSTDCDLISAFQKNLPGKIVPFSQLNARYVLNRLDTFNYTDPSQAWKKDFLLNTSSLTEEYEGDRVNLYRLDDKLFMPNVFVATNNLTELETDVTGKEVVNLMLNNKNQRSVFYKDFIGNRDILEKYSPPIIVATFEFRRVSPVKVIVRVHNASDSFPLIFLDAYNKGWNLYLSDKPVNYVNTDLLKDYKIINGNLDDQATASELDSYIGNGWVSTLGDGDLISTPTYKYKGYKMYKEDVEKYKVDFISKNFNGSIQNDNLNNGSFLDTFFSKSLDNENPQFKANGFFNGWLVDPQKICEENLNSCVKNDNGSYDLELTIEFFPERIYIISAAVSAITLIAVVGYTFIGQKKEENS